MCEPVRSCVRITQDLFVQGFNDCGKANCHNCEASGPPRLITSSSIQVQPRSWLLFLFARLVRAVARTTLNGAKAVMLPSPLPTSFLPDPLLQARTVNWRSYAPD